MGRNGVPDFAVFASGLRSPYVLAADGSLDFCVYPTLGARDRERRKREIEALNSHRLGYDLHLFEVGNTLRPRIVELPTRSQFDIPINQR